MSLFQKRSNGDSPFPVPPVSPFLGVSLFGGTTSDQSMRIAGVWACVRLLAETVSMMPLHAFTVRNGVHVPITDPPLIQRPAARDTMQDWLYQLMVSMLLRGNGYGQIVAHDRYGYPVQIEILDLERVSMSQDTTGVWTYTVNGVTVDSSTIFHIPAFRMPGNPKGLSPIAYAARTLGTVTAAESFGQGFFTDGAHPSSILTTDQPVSEENAQKIKARLVAAVNGREPAVLGAGVKWQAVQVTPEESQFLATQQFGISQIARIFGVPAELIGGGAPGSSITYANVTQRAMDYLTYSVQPWLTRIESAMFPLMPKRQHVRFDTSELVRLDPEAKWRVNAEKLNTASASINEVRADDDAPPVEWGDKPYLPAVKTTAAGIALQVGDQPGSGKATISATDDKPEETKPPTNGEPHGSH
ncbi:hypothetical protein ATY41_02755 [Leifsonia xyli subsp. xyli]|uniref:Phage-related portal protein n=2 Tax=Leifsonia xyli subsp. xyli TaxID=59736 RepID=Q6AC53_LEIXX|nr:phage portal protein [Leifsonia xyli]AAT90039.1 phage-related portal protein [Leifsonia xyli subsp. xyli str. CTCB07]ODA89978.1 hypothetical protein ATY41_02755 [Leifsonia xyli subsp. xyli]